MNTVTGRIHGIYISTDETVIQLDDGHIYICYNETLRYRIQKYVKFGMIVTLYIKDNEIQSIDIKL